jgi:hypothetical protein
MHCRNVAGSNACRRSGVVALRIADEQPLGPLQPEICYRRMRQQTDGKSLSDWTVGERVVDEAGSIDQGEG